MNNSEHSDTFNTETVQSSSRCDELKSNELSFNEQYKADNIETNVTSSQCEQSCQSTQNGSTSENTCQNTCTSNTNNKDRVNVRFGDDTTERESRERETKETKETK